MPAIFSKNCILEGEVDLYCLACCVYLQTEDDAISHIQGSKHKDIIKFLGYFEKHEQDFIRKVNGIYFCEMCNVTMSTATKVKLHVTEAGHSAGRRHRALARCARGDVVSPGGVRVSAGAWHGLLGDTCVLCAVESVHADTHTRDRAHVLNLIQAAVTIRDTGDVYRKIDDVYQCLTCNQVVSEQMFNEHLESKEHKEMIASCIKNQNNLVHSNEDQHVSKDETNAKTQEKTKKDEPAKINENLTKDNSKQNENKASMTKDTKTLAKKHGLIIKDNNNVYCDICNTKILATVDNIKKHIATRKHSFNKPQTKTDTPKAIKKININNYVWQIEAVQTTENGNLIIINDKYCIQFHSFAGINSYRGKIICQFCNIDLVRDNIESHLQSKSHLDLIMNASVIGSLDDEFVRQIKSDLYHCGYCGKTENDYDDMLDHLATSEHNTCKAELGKILMNFKIQLWSGRVIRDKIITNYNSSLLHDLNFGDIFF